MNLDSSMARVPHYEPCEIKMGAFKSINQACDAFFRRRGIEVEPSIMNAKQRAQRAAANRRAKR